MGNGASACARQPSVLSSPPTPVSEHAIENSDDSEEKESGGGVYAECVDSGDDDVDGGVVSSWTRPATTRHDDFHAAWSSVIRDTSGRPSMATWTRPLTRGAPEAISHEGDLVLGFEATETAVVRVQIGTVARFDLQVPADGTVTPALFGVSHLPIDTLKCESITVTVLSGDARVVHAVDPTRHTDVRLVRGVPWTYHAEDGRIFLGANQRLWEFTSLGLELPRVDSRPRP